MLQRPLVFERGVRRGMHIGWNHTYIPRWLVISGYGRRVYCIGSVHCIAGVILASS